MKQITFKNGVVFIVKIRLYDYAMTVSSIC
jgi:hypothetical protein